jgi:hypothetical protein
MCRSNGVLLIIAVNRSSAFAVRNSEFKGQKVFSICLIHYYEIFVFVDALKRHSDTPDMADVFKSTVQEFLKHAKSRIKSDE